MTDAAIFKGLLDNDATTLRHIYDAYFHPVARQVSARGGSREDQFDVFQDSISILYLNCANGKFDPTRETTLGGYLQGIANNVWRARRRQENKLATVSLEVAPPTADPEDEDHATLERAEQLDAAFAQLGNRCRRLLRLFYYENLPLKRIAELMTLTDKTAKNSKYRCMQELRALVTQQMQP